MVEFALILIPLLILVVGIIQFGIGLNYWLDMNRLSNQGARWAVVNEYPGCTRTSPTQGVSCGGAVSLQRYVACQRLPGALKPTVDISFPSTTEQCWRSRQGDRLIAVYVPRDHEAGNDHPGGEDHHAARASAVAVRLGSPHSDDVPMRASLPRRSLRERGQVAVLFALMLPMILALGGIVIGVGNWYVHGKNLQTKADAGAFGGGDSWAFPCGPQIDARIDAQARLYAGSNNPQVGGVPNSKIHPVLNGIDYYDDDNPATAPPPENNLFPPNTTLCAAEKLDVKVTEDNSFPLASLIPLFPDIKRRARVEIQEAEGLTGLLPIAIRAPEPLSAAAIFYDESSGNVKAVKYFVKSTTITGIPAGLQGWTTQNSEDNLTATSTWAEFTPGAETGVVVATSFRGACNTGLNFPGGNTKITTTAAPCFEDNYVGQPVGNICNQGAATQIVNCYWTTGNWPTEAVQSGLQFIQGYSNGNVPSGAAPEIRSAYLDSPSPATCGAYYAPLQPATCTALLHATIDVGSFDPDGPGPLPDTRSAADTEVRYRIVSDSGTYCAFNTGNCDLNGSGGPGNTSWVTTNNLPTFDSDSQRNSIAIRVRLRRTIVGGTTVCGNNFSATCEWFFTGAGRSTNVPTDAQVLANPVQRSFRGSTVSAGSTRWLRLTADQNCDGILDQIDGPAASQTTSSNHCFVMDMGLKGGLAVDANDPVVLFNDGVGPSQMGAVDCDPNIPQGADARRRSAHRLLALVRQASSSTGTRSVRRRTTSSAATRPAIRARPGTTVAGRPSAASRRARRDR